MRVGERVRIKLDTSCVIYRRACVVCVFDMMRVSRDAINQYDNKVRYITMRDRKAHLVIQPFIKQTKLGRHCFYEVYLSSLNNLCEAKVCEGIIMIVVRGEELK